jgi:hypothetical protein
VAVEPKKAAMVMDVYTGDAGAVPIEVPNRTTRSAREATGHIA